MTGFDEKLIRFANNVDGAVSNAIYPDQSNYNSGPLWQSMNRDNFRTATIPVEHAPMLNPGLQKYAPFEYGDALTVDALHHFGSNGDDFTYWMWPKGQEHTFGTHGKSINLTTSIWLHHPLNPSPSKVLVQGEFTDHLTDADYLNLTADLFPDHYPQIAHFEEQIDARNALALTILNLRNRTGWLRKSAKQVAQKTFPNSSAVNGFQVEASVYEESNAAEAVVKTLATVANTLYFTPESYGGLYSGRLRRSLTVTLNDGRVVDAKKSSKVTLMNNPYIKGEGRIGVYGNIYDENPVPPELQSLLYNDEHVSPEDLDEFTRLAVEPIDEDQTDIKP